MPNQPGGFFICDGVAFSSGSGFDFSKVKHSGVNVRFGAAVQRSVGAFASQCFYVRIGVRVVITLGQRYSRFVTAGVVGIVNGVHQVGLDGVIRDTKPSQCSVGSGRVTLVGLQNVGDLWVALDSVGDYIPGATCAVCTPSNRATGNDAKRSSLRNLFGNVTSSIELVELTFECSLRKTFFAAFRYTFFDGDLGAGLGKIPESLHRVAQPRTGSTQKSFLKSRAANTHRRGGSSRSNKRLALRDIHGDLVSVRRSLTHFNRGLVRFVVRASCRAASRFGDVCGDSCCHTCGGAHLGGNCLAVFQRKRSTLGTSCGYATNEKRGDFLDAFNTNVLCNELQWGGLERTVDCFERAANTFGVANYGVHVPNGCLVLRSITCFAKIVQRGCKLAHLRSAWRNPQQHRHAVDRLKETAASF